MNPLQTSLQLAHQCGEHRYRDKGRCKSVLYSEPRCVPRIVQRRGLRCIHLQKGHSWLSRSGWDSKSGEGWLEMEVRKFLDTESRMCQGSSEKKTAKIHLPTFSSGYEWEDWKIGWGFEDQPLCFSFPQGQEASWVEFYIYNGKRKGWDYTGLNKCALSWDQI